jgi:hypothetical protein
MKRSDKLFQSGMRAAMLSGMMLAWSICTIIWAVRIIYDSPLGLFAMFAALVGLALGLIEAGFAASYFRLSDREMKHEYNRAIRPRL